MHEPTSPLGLQASAVMREVWLTHWSCRPTRTTRAASQQAGRSTEVQPTRSLLSLSP